MADTESVRLVATIRGRVQGVGFRYFAEEEANRLGLTGYVRNMADRSVEVIAEGEKRLIEAFVVLLRRGPSAAEVTDLQVRLLPPTGEFRDFRVRPWSD